jgi:ribonucleoside-diphosphate reductase alpha chain
MHTADKLLTFNVKDYAYQYWKQEKPSSCDLIAGSSLKDQLPLAWVDISSLTPAAHLEVQGVMQPFVDNAISKTINIPRAFPFDKLADVYTRAYELGLKGCTIFRPNPITGSVLEEKTEEMVDRCCQQ